MRFENKTFILNLLIVPWLQIQLQLYKDFPTCFVLGFHYVSYIVNLIVIR